MKLESLSKEEQLNVRLILAGRRVLKIKYLHQALTKNEREYLAHEFAKRDYLDVAETCVWLGKCPSLVYRYIRSGKIHAFRSGAGKYSPYTIDVKKTRQNFEIEY